MSYQSSDSAAFRETTAGWIADHGEILVLFRFSHAGGNRSYEFFSSEEHLRERISQCAARTCVIAFRQTQLPLRGTVDDAFVHDALALVPDGKEYLIAALEPVHYGKASWLRHWSETSHQELSADLQDAFGTRAAFGPHPPWLEDNDDVISALVPEPDGALICGVY